MRRKPEIAVCVAVAAVVFASCGLRRGSGDAVKTFPAVSIPSVCSSPESRMEYALMHYWDGFEGVPADGIEKAMATYAAMLDEAPYGLAERSLVRLFDRICEAQAADTSAHYYALMTQMVSKYLYDPNSPLRNEELYLPFVSRMASSPLTPEEMIPAYEYEASSCAICRIGTKAPDFVARTMEGREFRMHSLTSDYVVMVFSNPGCDACQTVIDEISAIPGIGAMMESGAVTVMNVYIDGDLDKWREYASYYPSSWINACDRDGVIRDGRIYDVRAIPSVYLLDADKTVLLKDAPVQKVAAKILKP